MPHTSGPWDITVETVGNRVDGNPSSVIICAGDLDEDGYCEIRVDGDNAMANAKIIVGALGMLAALQSVVASHDAWTAALEPMKDRGAVFDDPISDAVSEARAAITEATRA